jgi:hypothetical protein
VVGAVTYMELTVDQHRIAFITDTAHKIETPTMEKDDEYAHF